MKIEAVHIKGFQSHIDSTFQLSPGLTVITGPSDAGKTAIVRALRWLAFNEPQGEAFLHTVRDQEGNIVNAVDQASVEVTFDDGTTVSKTRRKGKTTYRHSAFTEPWEKAELPPEIKETLGLIKQEYGDFVTCLNFAFQLDAPFLLSETASVGAKVLGKIAGTEIVDRANGEVNKLTHKARTEVAQAEKQIGQLDVELLEYLTLDDQIAEHKKLEADFKKTAEKADTREVLISLLSSYYDAHEDRIAKFDRLQPFAYLDITKAKLQTAEYNVGKLEAIKKYEADFWNAVKEQNEADTLIRKLRGVDDLLKRLGGVQKAQQELQAMESLEGQYDNLQHDIKAYTGQREQADAILSKKEAVGRAEKSAVKAEALKALRESHREATDGLGKVQAIVSSLENLNGLEATLGTLEAADAKRRELLQLKQSYESKKQITDNAKEMAEGYKRQAKQAKADLEAAWEAAGGICPLCGKAVGLCTD